MGAVTRVLNALVGGGGKRRRSSRGDKAAEDPVVVVEEKGTPAGKSPKGLAVVLDEGDADGIQVVDLSTGGKRKRASDLRTDCLNLQNHALLHALLERKFMTVDEARELCESITGDDSLFNHIGTLNRELQLVQLKIKVGAVPKAGGETGVQSYVSVVNLAKDESVTQSTKLSFGQMTYFKQIIEHIAAAKGTHASMIDLLLIEQALPEKLEAAGPSSSAAAAEGGTPAFQKDQMTKKEKEAFIVGLRDQGWLRQTRTEAGKAAITIGPRTYLELKSLLLEMDMPEALVDALKDL